MYLSPKTKHLQISHMPKALNLIYNLYTFFINICARYIIEMFNQYPHGRREYLEK